MPRPWAGGWGSNAKRCSPTSHGGTSAVNTAPTAILLLGLSGTIRASKSGKRRSKIGRVARRSSDIVRTIAPRNKVILNTLDETRVEIMVKTWIAQSWGGALVLE